MLKRCKIPLLCFSVFAVWAGGCASASKKSVDPVAGGMLRIECMTSDLVVLPPPTVRQEENALLVSGVVNGKEGVNRAVDGHVALLVVLPDGTEEEEIPLAISPGSIPASGERQASYHIRYGWTPRRGTVLRLLFDDKDHVASGNFGVAPNAAGSAAALPSGPRTPSAGGHPKSGMARKTPGTPKQRGAAPRTPGVGSGGKGHR